MITLQYVLQGIKRFQATNGVNKPRPRLPITSAIMRQLKRYWESKGPSYNHTMFWAAACTCFFGFLRLGEATVSSMEAYDPSVHLSVADISIDSRDSPTVVIVRIKASKTDPYRTGVDIHLGKTGKDLCPVAAVLSYINLRGLSPGPLFILSNGHPLSRETLVQELREALSAAGFDPSLYSGHSFRIGAATTAAAAGIGDALIKALGRWRSSAYSVYIKMPTSSLSALTSHIAEH